MYLLRISKTLGGILVWICLFHIPVHANEFVRSVEFKCSQEFPCFPELKSRIEFWIEVFARYHNHQAVFHDSDVPDRVYAVVDGLTCSARSRSEKSKIERERTKWKNTLKDLAQKIETGQTLQSPEEIHVFSLFKDPSGDELRDASSSVRCQQGNRDRFAKGLARYGAYREFILAALKEHGLPSDIQYLPFVESAFNPKAYSRVGAAGLWQIMPSTGRRLGLKMGIHSDERLDPYHSTQAAARYLKQAYETLQAVPLPESVSASTSHALGPFAITSYNYGITGMRKALRRFGPDFVRVLNEYEGRRFRTAVRNFYVSFLAAKHVAQNSESYRKP